MKLFTFYDRTRWSYSFDVNSYVRKPVDFAEFQKAVKVLAIYWLMMNQPPPERGTA